MSFSKESYPYFDVSNEFSGSNTLREKCSYSEFFSQYSPAFKLNPERYSVSLRIQSEYEKTLTRKTSNTDAFNAVIMKDNLMMKMQT